MEEQKLNSIYSQCLNELAAIGINMRNKELIGTITIKLTKEQVKDTDVASKKIQIKDIK